MLNCCLCCSVAKSCLTLSDPTDCSMPGFPVLQNFLEFAQSHIPRVNIATQPSYPLSSPSPPALNLSQHQVFSDESVLHIRWPKYWSFSFSISPSNEYSGLVSFRIDWFDLLAVQGTLKRHLSTTVRKHQSSALSLLYGPTLTSIYWKNQSFD